MTISVLIPAFRAGRFLAQTLQSAIEQTQPDIRIHVHIDPSDADGSGKPEDSLQAVEPFRSDPRVHVRCNPQRLGWDANIRGLMREIDTPYYAILPHDDVWDPRYLQVLCAELASSANASVAYCDQISFGVAEASHKAVRLPRGGSLRAQLLAFLLAGAEAMPWRGVVRSDLLSRIGEFPVDGYRGFAAECEYALSLLLAGTAIHVPSTMYRKRFFPANVSHASRQRIVEAAPAELHQAWTRHAACMHALLRDGLCRRHAAPDCSDLLLLAAMTAAMLRRYQQCLGASLEAEQRDAVIEAMHALGKSTEDGVGAVLSRLQLVMSRHAGATGNNEQGDALAKRAVATDANHHEARLYLAKRLQAGGLFAEALDCASLLERRAPGMVGVGPLLRQLRSRVA
jgi:GT2 family glycosyltransferase